jgi:isoleucyl-tRNA synthetase
MPEGAKCSECGCTEFKKETDIMDVWFDSGSTHESVLAERGLPEANLYLEGSDQYRGWFQSSLLTSVATKNKAPYKEVVTHGYVVDEQGRKMSKSLGNGIDPIQMCDELGADILRLWALSSDYTSDVSISKGILKQVAEVYRKIRNTARFILGNIDGLDVNSLTPYGELEEIDKFALIKLNKLIADCTKAYDEYDFNKAYQTINTFCVVDMSNFYLDIIKDRLYTSKPDSKERKSAQTAMYLILDALVKILAPMTCFTAEEIWKYMPHTEKENVESVMLTYYPEVNSEYENKELEAKWERIIKIKEDVAKKLEEARAAKVIGHSLNAKVIISAEGSEYEFLKNNEELLMTVFIVSGLEVVQGASNIKVEVADGEKCERCWMYSTTVGEDKENPTICHRCSENLK